MQKTIKWTSLFVGAIWLGIGWRCYAGDADVKLTTTNGTTQFTVQDSNANVVASITSLGTVTISSNTVLPGTTFYQGGKVTMSSATANGFFQFSPHTKAELAALVPAAKGQAFYCSDCVATPLCISTNTVAGAFGAVSSSSTLTISKCQ